MNKNVKINNLIKDQKHDDLNNNHTNINHNQPKNKNHLQRYNSNADKDVFSLSQSAGHKSNSNSVSNSSNSSRNQNINKSESKLSHQTSSVNRIEMLKCKQNEDDNEMFAKLENDVSNNHLDNYLNSQMDDKVASTKNYSETNNSLNYNKVIDYPSIQKQKIEDIPCRGGS